VKQPQPHKGPRGTTRKHAGGAKHAPHQARGKQAAAAGKGAGGKHHPAHKPAAPAHAVAKHPKHPHQKRQLSPGSAVACCSPEALAASLRLTGRAVSDEDVLALYWRTTSDPDGGASILGTLEAAAEYGLAGARPVSFRPVDVIEQVEPCLGCGFHLRRPAGVGDDGDLHIGPVHPASVILGVTLRGGRHSLTLDPSGLAWSWGGLYELPAGRTADEAWEVRWAA
jgi:hypothetical protein